MACLEESLFSSFDVNGRRVEVSSARSGQSFSVVLDFHLPILLTDICIPANPLLSSVSVDVWLAEGETPLRVLHAKDLSSKSVSLGNLSPSPLCQFAKASLLISMRCGVPPAHCSVHILSGGCITQTWCLGGYSGVSAGCAAYSYTFVCT